MDFINGGQAYGGVAARLLNNEMDPGVLRPWIGENGQVYVTRMVKNQLVNIPISNSVSALRKDDWLAYDHAILQVAKPRMKVWGDLQGAGLTYDIPGGLGKTVLLTERQSDISPATVSMSGTQRGENDKAVYDSVNLPLPIIHKDFTIQLRDLAASRQGGNPIDTTNAKLAAQRVVEELEMLTIGTKTGITFGGGTVYGLRNFPQRLTGTGTIPTAGGWTPAVALAEVLAMRLQSQQAFHFGPWKLYCSTPWDTYMDSDYNLYKGLTLRQRIEQIRGISSCETLDYIQNTYEFILVEQSDSVIRAVTAMPLSTFMWEEQGGWEIKMKVAMIGVPQTRCDQNNNTGIVHHTQAA